LFHCYCGFIVSFSDWLSHWIYWCHLKLEYCSDNCWDFVMNGVGVGQFWVAGEAVQGEELV
jgi:hypothetical protein